jgi:hypothetical protein
MPQITVDVLDYFPIYSLSDYQTIENGQIYRLEAAGHGSKFGTFSLRTSAHLFDFLLNTVPLLTQAGFEIFGEENLKNLPKFARP